jgi:uncharacterized damage-inducible protein DinB
VSANILENVYENMLTHVHKVIHLWLAHFSKGEKVGEEEKEAKEVTGI